MSDVPRIYSNRDIEWMILGIPTGHKHLRLVIKVSDGLIVFHEATIAAMVRAYIDIKTHPTRRAVKLVGGYIPNRKEGYADYQLVEVGDGEDEIIKDIDEILGIN